MNNSEIFKESQPLQICFRIIGVGASTADIIEKVKSFGYDSVGCRVVNSAAECIPTDEDQMAIIVAREKGKIANEIARTYHEAGVLTIGLLNSASTGCYDSIALNTHFSEFPDIIKTLLQSIVTSGMICFDFNDLRMALRDSGFFKILTVETDNVENAVSEIQKSLDDTKIVGAEYVSVHVYFNRKKRPEIKMDDMAHLTKLISSLSESVNAMWSVNYDDTLPDDKIRLSIILSGKKLE